jgi:tetratricopeptide (TPR) repeat protein
MQTPPIIPKPAMGKTFIVAISLLGVIAAVELIAVGWAFIARSRPSQQSTAPESKLDLADTFTPPAGPQPAPVAPSQAPSVALPGPTPVSQASSPPAPPEKNQSPSEIQLTALVVQARALRERGDTSTALTRLREALTISPSEPQIISELAITYEKMGLSDKALDQWKRIFEMGESAGIYYAAAEAKIKNSEAPPKPEAAASPEAAVQPDSTLGLLDVVSKEEVDSNGANIVSLKIPVKAKPGEKIEVSEVGIRVFFYDIIDDRSIVQTNANVSFHWTKLPADWIDSDIEILEVEYSQPMRDPKEKQSENRKYYGYEVRIYYKNSLQDIRAEPVKLLKQFPPPVTLTDDGK